MIVLSYDVDTTDAAGAKRLRKVAKICEAKGCRVQNSVFELLVDPAASKVAFQNCHSFFSWFPILPHSFFVQSPVGFCHTIL